MKITKNCFNEFVVLKSFERLIKILANNVVNIHGMDGEKSTKTTILVRCVI